MDALIKLDQVDEIRIDLQPVSEIPIDFGDMVGIVRPPELESIVVTPTEEEQVITPSKFGTYFDKATIKPIPEEYADVSDVDATAEDVLNGKVFVDSEGNKVQGTAELKEDLTTELTAQNEAITRLEVAVDELPEPKADISEVKIMDWFDNVLSGRPIVERDYTEKEIAKLDRILANITQGEVVNG